MFQKVIINYSLNCLNFIFQNKASTEENDKGAGKSGDGAKITELEDELSKLRAQIAMIISAGGKCNIKYQNKYLKKKQN